MTGLKCDRCEYVTQTEDDHTVTEDGQYLCLKCAEIVKNLIPNNQKIVYAIAQGTDAKQVAAKVNDYLKQGYRPWGNIIHTGNCYTQPVVKEIE